MIKKILKMAARKMSTWPFIGRIIRICIAIIRLPCIRSDLEELKQWKNYIDHDYNQKLHKSLDDIQQIQHRLCTLAQVHENYDRSLPVILRKTTRDIDRIYNELTKVDSSSKRTTLGSNKS